MYYPIFIIGDFMSEKTEKMKITYRPNLDYEKNYDTIGLKPPSNQITIDDNTKPARQNVIRIKDIKQQISNINSLLIKLPLNIASTIFDLNLSIDQTLPFIDDTSKDSQSDSDNKQNSNSNSEDSNNDNDGINNNQKSNMSNGKIINLPSSSLDADVIYTPDKIDQVKSNTLIDAFNYLILSIYNEYLINLNDGISTYYMNLIMGNKIGDINDLYSNYDTNTADISMDYKHLSDNVIRSDYIYDQKSRLLRKLFTYNNSISHFNSAYASKQFCDRYEAENPIRNEYSHKDKFVRDTWLATKASYYNKYCNSISNLYKYYNSCYDLISECLNMKAQSYIARNILNK